MFTPKEATMRKSLMVGVVSVLAIAWCLNAYAADGSPIQGLFDAIGGFLYNAMPWNWSQWMGK